MTSLARALVVLVLALALVGDAAAAASTRASETPRRDALATETTNARPSDAPRRALLVTKEAGVSVDPVGVVRSVTLSSSVSINFFCEFVKPFLDFDLPPTYC